MKTYRFTINGLDIQAEFDQKDIDEVFFPLLRKLTALQKKAGRRIIVFLAAPPGCGKSTLACFLSHLSLSDSSLTPLQVLGMDGFHHYNDYLNSHYDGQDLPLSLHKGRYDTFDVAKLSNSLKELHEHDICWPLYDRNIHEPLENAISVEEKIILLEGNYLLYNRKPWDHLVELADYTIMMKQEPQELKRRLISRKVQGGSSLQEATDWYENSDRHNVEAVLNNHYQPDLMLSFDASSTIINREEIKQKLA